ncbi:enoyl-CoA hydratase [Arthrobacter silviterrae]|uniref:Enoyl-CoA hydratase/isomerase family protein n=1 Tax=Arthrobacter silviterrae TaxID=2026658 RepID=A0ABX0DI22_9MICC|nr:enoyl-CoA hydratase/isomerase family protein [Arthrobacter silviterrae]MDQ0276677.1 enoyl-CoA hydratase [Arthrobacter silviterrae]NGN85401.1 enoyl-CoA hydratase/isomerase family protein [Arthrobacter silviterrae]
MTTTHLDLDAVALDGAPLNSAAPDAIALDATGPVATLTLGTGRRLNALRPDDWAALARDADSLAGREDLRAVVIRGGGGVFCSGSDLREWDGATQEEVSESFAGMEAALQAVEDIPVPTVAVVEGFGTGAGCQLALACDLQLVNRSAKIGMPIGRLGLLVPATFATRMSLLIGPGRTKELLYGGRLLPAPEAHQMGLITTLVEDGAVDDSLTELLAQWDGLSAASLRASKAAVNYGLTPLVQPARRAPQGAACDPDEFAWRLDAFLNRHRPHASR